MSNTTGVTKPEVAFLVMNYLKQEKYNNTLNEFLKECQFVDTVNAPMSKKPKNLHNILDEYVHLKVKDSQKAKFLTSFSGSTLIKTMEALFTLLDDYTSSRNASVEKYASKELIQETSLIDNKHSLVDVARLNGTRKPSRSSKKKKDKKKSDEFNKEGNNINNSQINRSEKHESNNNSFNGLIPSTIYENNIRVEKFPPESINSFVPPIDWNNNQNIIHDEQTNLFPLEPNEFQPIYNEMIQNPDLQQKIADEINQHLSARLAQNNNESFDISKAFQDDDISSIVNSILNNDSLKSLSAPSSPEKTMNLKREREESMNSNDFVSIKKRKNYSPPKSRSRRSSPTKYGYDRSNDSYPIELFREDSSDPFLYNLNL